MSGTSWGSLSQPVATAPAPAPTYTEPTGYWIPDPNYMGDSSPPMIWVSTDYVAPQPAPAPEPTLTTGGSLLDQVLAMYQAPVTTTSEPIPAPAPTPTPVSTAIAPTTAGTTTGGAGSTTPIYTAPSASGISFLDQVRQEALRLQAAGTLDAAVAASSGGSFQPNPHYTGDSSPPMVWVPNPTVGSPPPVAGATPAAPPPPPQLPFQAPTAADFASRNSPELAQMQVGIQQQGIAPIPFAQRGMQNGLFAGATGGLPGTGTQNTGMSPMQLMQLLAQSGLMGGG